MPRAQAPAPPENQRVLALRFTPTSVIMAGISWMFYKHMVVAILSPLLFPNNLVVQNNPELTRYRIIAEIICAITYAVGKYGPPNIASKAEDFLIFIYSLMAASYLDEYRSLPTNKQIPPDLLAATFIMVCSFFAITYLKFQQPEAPRVPPAAQVRP